MSQTYDVADHAPERKRCAVWDSLWRASFADVDDATVRGTGRRAVLLRLRSFTCILLVLLMAGIGTISFDRR